MALLSRVCLIARVCSFLEFSVEEYDETKAETLDQLREFQAFLERSLRGDMTLVDEFGHAQLVRKRWGVEKRGAEVMRLEDCG